MVLTKFGPHGEVLRKRKIKYIIKGGDPRDLGYEISTDHNEEMCLISKDGRIFTVGQMITISDGKTTVTITRVLGDDKQQKDLGEGKKDEDTKEHTEED